MPRVFCQHCLWLLSTLFVSNVVKMFSRWPNRKTFSLVFRFGHLENTQAFFKVIIRHHLLYEAFLDITSSWLHSSVPLLKYFSVVVSVHNLLRCAYWVCICLSHKLCDINNLFVGNCVSSCSTILGALKCSVDI